MCGAGRAQGALNTKGRLAHEGEVCLPRAAH